MRLGEEPSHLDRVRHPGGIAEADLLSACVAQARSDRQNALGWHMSLIGAAERGRDHTLAPQAGLASPCEHRLEAGERLLDRAVDVLAVVGLRSRQEDIDLVDP